MKYGWAQSYSAEALAHAVDSLDDQPLGYRINIFLARICFRGIYFPMMGRMAWPKVIFQNRRTIFKLVREAIFGGGLHRPQDREVLSPELAVPYGDAAVEEVASQAGD